MSGWYWLVSQLPFEWAQYEFMSRALLAVLLISPVLALMGCMVINNHMTFFSDAMGHSALTGIALGVLLGVGNPLWAMIAFSIALVFFISMLRRYSMASMDTIIGLTMAFSVALGVVLLSRGGGFTRYSRYLIGDILTIGPSELGGLAAMIVAVLAIWIWIFNSAFLVSVNPLLARSRGVPAQRVELLFSMLVALLVTVSLQWIGLLVINSLLVLPAAAARNIARRTSEYIWGAVAAGLFSGLLGLITSYYLASATGATIVLFSMLLFMLSLLVSGRRR